ncbi:MFS general substrate transporter [Patellaria atrata CBS 101060]|uniref:MFS general substrate transporter n=1 Tax=Patellaria atrata CBS 101060 TaxID=1346257 RepID=A0A9P4S9K2_9PEZI|nr:MFS general substrate transporter [Patellaria atrata CBS 101060]
MKSVGILESPTPSNETLSRPHGSRKPSNDSLEGTTFPAAKSNLSKGSLAALNPTPEPEATESQYLTSWRLYIVIACLFFGVFLVALDTHIITVAVPKIISDFHSLEDVAWYGTAYLVTSTAFQPIYGSLYKFFDTKLVYSMSILVFEVGSIICAAATSSNLFIIGRAVAGLGGAGIFQGALAIVGKVIVLEQRPIYFSIVASVFAISIGAGPPLGGVFTEKSTWRWCFWINLPIGAVVLFVLTYILKIKEEDTENRILPFIQKLDHLDPLSCTVFLGSVVCILLALQWGGQTKSWDSPTIIGLLVGSGVLAILFVGLQWWRQDKALIPPRIFRKRTVYTSVGVVFFLGGSAYLNPFFLSFYFQAVRGVGQIDAGVDLIPILLSQIVAMVVVGTIVKIWGHYVPCMIVGELICVVGTALLTQLKSDTSTVIWAVYLFVSGFGMGMAVQLPYTAIQIALSEDDVTTANGIVLLSFLLGGAIAISMGQTITITTILDEVPKMIPGLSPHDVIAAGSAYLDLVASSEEILHVLRSIWSIAISRTMILSVALVGAAVPFTLGMEWLNAKKISEARKREEEDIERERRAAEEREREMEKNRYLTVAYMAPREGLYEGW